MTMTNPPPVAPVEGFYALLRNGAIVLPLIIKDYTDGIFSEWTDGQWNEDGTFKDYRGRTKPHLDIIATVSPADMQAVASGRLVELIDRVLSLSERVVQSDVNCGRVYDYVHVDLTDVVELKQIATALQGDAP